MRTRLNAQMHPDDAAAIAEAMAGDPEAFRVLVERHGRSLFRLAYRLTGNRQDAEDVVQDTFVRAYRQLSRFEARSNFGTWLYRIGFNCAIDHVRARPSRELAVPDTTIEASLDTRTPGADDLVYAGQIGARVREALDHLTTEERVAFVLRHYQGCSIDEVSATLEVGRSAAKHAIFRAVRKLRAALEPLLDRATALPAAAAPDGPARRESSVGFES